MQDSEICVWLTPDQLEEVAELIRCNITSSAGIEGDAHNSHDVIATWTKRRGAFVAEHVANHGEKERRFAESLVDQFDFDAGILQRLVRASGATEGVRHG